MECIGNQHIARALSHLAPLKEEPRQENLKSYCGIILLKLLVI